MYLKRPIEEDEFWNEVKSYGYRPPPKQVINKLTGGQYEPGIYATLTFFWHGLTCYGDLLHSLKKHGEKPVREYWLEVFMKPAKATQRVDEDGKTTSHNLALFERAWHDLVSQEFKDYLAQGITLRRGIPTIYSLEYDTDAWNFNHRAAARNLWQAIEHANRAAGNYQINEWSLGLAIDDKNLSTQALGVDYDRLLFHAEMAVCSAKMKKPELLPNAADKYLSPRNMLDILPVARSLPACNPKVVKAPNVWGDYGWPQKDHMIPMLNGCTLYVTSFEDGGYGEKIGQVVVSTPRGSFLEQYEIGWQRDEYGKDDWYGPEIELRDDYFHNGLADFFKKGSAEKKIAAEIRQTIAYVVAEARPSDRLDIPGFAVAPPASKSKVKRSRVRIPKGNPLYGKL